MMNKKKVLIGMIIIVAILIVLHISINYLVPIIISMHQGNMQF